MENERIEENIRQFPDREKVDIEKQQEDNDSKVSGEEKDSQEEINVGIEKRKIRRKYELEMKTIWEEKERKQNVSQTKFKYVNID